MSLKKELAAVQQQKKDLEVALEDEKRKNGELEEKVRKLEDAIKERDVKIKKLEGTRQMTIQKLKGLRGKLDGSNVPGKKPLTAVKQEARGDSKEEAESADGGDRKEVKLKLCEIKMEKEEETDQEEDVGVD